MDIKALIKKPVVIANLSILVLFLLLPYNAPRFGAFNSAWFSFAGFGTSNSGIGLFFSIFDHFRFVNLLSILIPVICGYLLFQTWKNSDQFVAVSKIALLVVIGIVFLNFAFIVDRASIRFVGIGLWLSLLVATAQVFEAQIMAKLAQARQTKA